ncbi:hypothetical protein BKG93_10525 [Rodentibacter ratti]|uniref:Toxin VasX N-terminal region domain-containing protein n=1 Tax=Rodentibacter ratti TaxID=1906745 RepID=A0A1V3KZT6_9PAST|nr:toxin VasX [Rodentibacter ratti]OOF83194.1 hypothetical protein BKG93_10525 [Rodentibacter ratti]
MENSKKESSTPRKDLKLLKEEAKKLSITNNKCEQPFIPIYPVRYALSGDYLDSAQASLKNNGLETTSNIADIPRPDSMRRGRIHQLQQLRQGYVYIYCLYLLFISIPLRLTKPLQQIKIINGWYFVMSPTLTI